MLSQVLTAVRKGWPAAVPERLLPYWQKQEELGVEGDAIIIIPPALRPQVLQTGAGRMKAFARSLVWWAQIE